MAKTSDNTIKDLMKNKKAYFNYEIIEDLECGISLEGTEVKSIREGRFSFGDSFIQIENGKMKLVHFAIEPYKYGGQAYNHKLTRERLLLAHKDEIKKYRRKVDEKGFTLVPTKVYLKGNLVKVQVSLCRGRNVVNKKNMLKDRDIKRDTERTIKNMRQFL